MAAVVGALGMLASAASGPAVAAAQQPNVMIVISDDQRDDQMKVMSQARAIFGAGGTKFSNGYVTTPLCCPSRSSILTGQYVHNHGVEANGGYTFPHKTSLQRELSGAGYSTGVFGKFLNGWPQRRKPPYFDVARLGYGSQPRFADKLTGERVRRFVRRQERNDTDPWFAVYSARAPHSPLVPLRKYDDARVPRFKPRPSYLERNLTDKPPVIRRKAVEQRPIRKRLKLSRRWRDQARLLLGLDDQIGKTFKAMTRLDESRNTLVFYLSDNGYLLGEHRLLRKGAPYQEALEVPFYMRWPDRVPGGAIDRRLAANIDIAPTIYDAAGISPSYTVDGHSLLGPQRRRWAFAEHGARPWNWAQVFDGSSRYIETYRGSGALEFREFYDLDQDPFELVSLFAIDDGTATDPRVIAARETLRQARSCAGPTCP